MISDQTGYWDRIPIWHGIALPAISPAFYPWIPGSFFMAIGGLLLWVGARPNRRLEA